MKSELSQQFDENTTLITNGPIGSSRRLLLQARGAGFNLGVELNLTFPTTRNCSSFGLESTESS
ncbi:hypothetical protein Peur_006265 [Populus x canadensis]